jgi:hypothetical protein
MRCLSTPIPKDFAQWMGNSLYPIMLGLALAQFFTVPALAAWPASLLVLFALMVFYYVLDWLSYNAVLESSSPLPHGKLVALILAPIAFGAALICATRFFPEHEVTTWKPEWTTRSFGIFFTLYLVTTTIGSWVITYRAICAKESDATWLFVVVLIRFFPFGIMVLYTLDAFLDFATRIQPATKPWFCILAIVIFSFAKVVAYEFILLRAMVARRATGATAIPGVTKS